MAKEIEITLSVGKALIRKLNAAEAMQATSYCGAEPSGAVVNQATAVCAIRKIGDEDVAVTNRGQFLALAQRLDSEDIILVGMALRQLSTLTDEQKKDLERLLSGEDLSQPQQDSLI